MKLCYITPSDCEPRKVSASHNINDVNLAYAMGCKMMYPSTVDVSSLSEYDGYLVTMSKIRMPHENAWMSIVHKLKNKYPDKPIFMYQEDMGKWMQTRPLEEQFQLLDALKKTDVFLAHNHWDAEFFKLFRDKPVVVADTLIDVESIVTHRINPANKPEKIIVFGASFDSRANGMTGYRICRKYFPDYKIMQFSRDGNIERENKKNELVKRWYVDNWESIPYSGWFEWIKCISKAYIALHLMPVAAAGRNAIAFAALGIPLIATKECDTQQKLFPHTAVDVYNIPTIVHKCRFLLNSNGTYECIRNHATKNVNYFSIENGGKRIRERIRKYGFAL